MTDKTISGWRHRRAQRALERQLDFQQRKSAAAAGHEPEVMKAMSRSSERVRSLLETFRSIEPDSHIIEVGSGATGLIFFFPGNHRVGVDPLAVHYRTLFPAWQGRAQTVAAFGERLPFAEQSFDVVLCDNVIDHAEDPPAIVSELVRILRFGGLVYFTVNIHHPIYSVAAHAHSTWNALGIRYEIGPFADHTTHLTLTRARQLFSGLPVTILHEKAKISEAKAKAKTRRARHLGDSVKRVFFKNAVYEVIARRQ
jgi:SAM-dependent methyltransferase